MIYVLSNNIKNIKTFLMKFSIFTALKNLTWACFCNVGPTKTHHHAHDGGNFPQLHCVVIISVKSGENQIFAGKVNGTAQL